MSIYSDVINVDDLGEKRDTFSDDRGELSYWCKDCESIVKVDLVNNKNIKNTKNKEREILQTNNISKTSKKEIYECNTCKGNNLALGTEEGLKGFYLRKKF